MLTSKSLTMNLEDDLRAALSTGRLRFIREYIRLMKLFRFDKETTGRPWHEIVTNHRRIQVFPPRLVLESTVEVPVIFMTSLESQQGPVHGQPIFHLDGSDESRRSTMIDGFYAHQSHITIKKDAAYPSTAFYPHATWINLLHVVQEMEFQSQYSSFMVGIQRVRRTYTSASLFERPCAMSSLCTVIELAAMLGLYWKEFDRVTDRFYAEGNGYILRGFRVESILVFAFEDNGLNTDRKSYLIRTSEVREMCYGIVPTLLGGDVSPNKCDFKKGDLVKEKSMDQNAYQNRALPTLLLGSTEEIRNTLIRLGCDSHTIECTCSSNTGTHIFPVLFELVGMLARVMHKVGTRDTLLPNPTIFPFVKHQISLPRLLEAFVSLASEELPDQLSEKTDDGDARYFFELQRILSNAQDLVVELGQIDQDTWSISSSPNLMRQFYEAIVNADSMLRQVNRSLVREIVREHLRQVCRAINTSSGDAKHEGIRPEENRHKVETSHTSEGRVHTEETTHRAWTEDRDHLPHSSFPRRENGETSIREFKYIAQTEDTPESRMHIEETHSCKRAEVDDDREPGQEPRQTSFEALRHVPAEQREHFLMKFYFEDIRPIVVSTLQSRYGQSDKSRGKSVSFESEGKRPLRTEETSVPDPYSSPKLIWNVLVFRMICWLSLHDFDEKDVQISKSEVLGSEIPIYIV
ncbi:hypothetical protein F4680DRAFT_72354 [Xylaria scruposa]|nr:hypothetical protein F4680DRAFT_72354 [Xylaria scruposa]